MNSGKRFEMDLAISCKESKIFFHKIKDIHIPFNLRSRIAVPKNEYDCFVFYRSCLFSLELKSTKQKSISFDEKIIKNHQIENLKKASEYNGVVAGFLFNFRSYGNKTYFVEINDFAQYKEIAENNLDHQYQSRVNKSSISLDICEEIGFELKNEKKRVNYRYHVEELLGELIINGE